MSASFFMQTIVLYGLYFAALTPGVFSLSACGHPRETVKVFTAPLSTKVPSGRAKSGGSSKFVIKLDSRWRGNDTGVNVAYSVRVQR